MRIPRNLILVAIAIFFGSTVARAETVGFVTIPVGSLSNVMTQVMAKVVQSNSDLKVRVIPVGGATATVVSVSTGAAEFAIGEINNLTGAVQGKYNFKKPIPKMRLVMSLLAFPVGIIVRNDSNIKTIADMKGRKYPVGWQAFPNGVPLSQGMLASGGLNLSDIVGVPTSNLGTAANDFKAGKIDATMVAAGSPMTAEINASIKGGVRFLSLPGTPKALAQMKQVRSEYGIMTIQPAPRFAGIAKPTNVLRVDQTIYTSTDVSDGTVYKFLKAIYENKKGLVKGHPVFNGFFPDKRMAKQFLIVKYHPAAIKFFKEKGIWPGK